MTNIISAFLSVMILISSMGTYPKASPENAKATPTGIVYEQIGKSIDSYIEERKAGLASCSVSVFGRNGTIYNGFYGYADIENSVPADEQTVYEWGSSSKILVWISVMQQWERGNIDFEKDIRTYLPEGFLTKLKYPEEKITMLDLMNHKAGFQESFFENQEAAPDDVYDSLEDAVRACECYQAYHVGEFTSYSNWGTALAAYIVERTSGLDYVTYVNRNIFAPLRMEHSSIDPQQKDNEWVAQKRHELKCYCRFADPKDNQDFGECRYAVQLFPAGACMSTLADFSALGRALVAEDCPLFKNSNTRAEMFGATSYYGDTDVAKNCHGLWTNEYKVETLGHSGNTFGCTANLEFDPVSGLGVAILTNESGETAFCNGIPVLLYGHYTDRAEYKNYDGNCKDISGVYYSKRSICEGAASGMQYMDSVFPLSKNGDGTYSVKLFGVTFNDTVKFIPVGDNQYIYDSNGMEMFVYVKDGIFEMGYMDYYRSSTGAAPTVVNYGFIIFGLICLLPLLIKLIALMVRRARKLNKRYTKADKMILLQQAIYAVSGIIYALFALVMPGTPVPSFVTVSCILASALAVVSLANGGMLCLNTVKSDVKARTKIKQYTWAVICLVYFLFIIGMQMYCFWKV